MRHGGSGNDHRGPSRIRPVPFRIPVHMITNDQQAGSETGRQILPKIGREPTPEELAEKAADAFEKVRKVMKSPKEPISLERNRR